MYCIILPKLYSCISRVIIIQNNGLANKWKWNDQKLRFGVDDDEEFLDNLLRRSGENFQNDNCARSSPRENGSKDQIYTPVEQQIEIQRLSSSYLTADAFPKSIHCVDCNTSHQSNNLCVRIKNTLNSDNSSSLDAEIIKTEPEFCADELPEELSIANDFLHGENGLAESKHPDLAVRSRIKTFSEHKLCHTNKKRFPTLKSTHSKEIICRKFPCTVCSERFDLKSSLKAHMKTHSNEKHFYCDLCGMGFKFERSLKNHVAVRHRDCQQEKSTECETCGQLFQFKSQLRTHQKKFIKNGAEDKELHLAGSKKPTRKPPQNIHDGSCNVCGERFQSMKALQRHYRVMHPSAETKPFSCVVCNKDFSSYSGFREHKRLHTNHYYPCDLCVKKFLHKAGLREHINAIHTKEMFSCDICGHSYKSKLRLKNHKKVHDQEAIICDLCGKSFSFYSRLKAHMNSAHSDVKDFTCDRCGLKVKSSRSLRLHKALKHDNIQPQKNIVCDTCGAKFQYSSQLITHMKRHTRSRPFPCPQCPKAFSNVKILRIHEKIHTGETPYVCASCGEAFPRFTLLQKHRKLLHFNDKPRKRKNTMNALDPQVQIQCSEVLLST